MTGSKLKRRKRKRDKISLSKIDIGQGNIELGLTAHPEFIAFLLCESAVSTAICPPRAGNSHSRTHKKATPAKTTPTKPQAKKATPAKRTPGKKTPLKKTPEKATQSLSKRPKKSPSSIKTLGFVCYEDPSDGSQHIIANGGKNLEANIMTSYQSHPGLKLRDSNISNTAKGPGDSFKASYNTPEKMSKSAARKRATPDKCTGSSTSCRRSPRLQALRKEEKKASARSKKCLLREPTAKGDALDMNTVSVIPMMHAATCFVSTSGSTHKGIDIPRAPGTTTPLSCKTLLSLKQHQQSNLSTPSGIKTSVFQTPSPVNPHLHAATGIVKSTSGCMHKGVVYVRNPSPSNSIRTSSPLNAFQTPSSLNTFRTPSPLQNSTGLGSFRTPLQPPQVSASKMKATPPLCRCGRRSKRRMVQNPGPNMGRWFFSCGKGTQSPGSGDSRKAGCTFFQWEPSQGTPSASTYRPICHSVNRSHLLQC